LMQNGNILRLIDFHKGEFEMQWAVPFYDPKSDCVEFIVWNEASDSPANVLVIINDHDIISFNNMVKFTWQIRTVGKIEDINTITTLINGKMKNRITIDESNRELFKETNRAYYE